MVLQVLGEIDRRHTASAKLTADWGVDYFHLAKYEGKWKIVHVLWAVNETEKKGD